MEDSQKKPSRPPSFNPNALEFNPANIQEFRPSSFASSLLPVDAPEFVPSNLPQSTEQTQTEDGQQQEEEIVDGFSQLHVEDYTILHPQPSIADHLDPFLFETGPILPLQHHLYAPPPTSVNGLPTNQKTIQSFFISEDLRQHLTTKSELLLKQPLPEVSQTFPRQVNSYHTLLPLGYKNKSHRYKATSLTDGQSYYLKRLEGFSLVSGDSINFLEPWTKLRHPNILTLKEGFTTHAFNDDSLLFVYEYQPTAVTLAEHFFPSAKEKKGNRKFQKDTASHGFIYEENLWSIFCQIVSALRVIHSRGLAYRYVNMQKILWTGENRIRLGCCGVPDLALYNPLINIVQYQHEDMLSLGQLMLALACKTQSVVDLQSSVNLIAQTYSPDFNHAILYLITNLSGQKSIEHLMVALAPQFMRQFELSQISLDTYENELMRELENSRLVRLMIKLGFINERPEFGMDPQWSETGDRYLLKLFRDYVFHQVDNEGKPVIDLAHVISCLNMLDTGSPERVMLASRDERSCLIVSYQDLKRCTESAFGELLMNSNPS